MAESRQESFDEIPESELAAQAGREFQPERLTPYDEGRKAAADGLTLANNPYGRSTGQRKPWSDGWKSYIADASKPTAEPAADPANGDGPVVHRLPKDGVVSNIQQPLPIGVPNVASEHAQELAADYSEKIISRVGASDEETKARKACEVVMLEENLDFLALPNGGKLVKEKIEETQFHYESPKKKKISKVEQESGGEQEERKVTEGTFSR